MRTIAASVSGTALTLATCFLFRGLALEAGTLAASAIVGVPFLVFWARLDSMP